ncbi:MAG: acyltransferase family protein [Nocardioidaceae bacterium]
MVGGGTLGSRFESQPNALNTLRICFAVAVVIYHSRLLPWGAQPLSRPVQQLLGGVPVDGFFAISGFLVCRSWDQRPDVGRFLVARATRILPAFWCSLVVTGFVLAPLAAHLAGLHPLSLTGGLDYVTGNAGGFVTNMTIDGSPARGIQTASWNPSLWTLWWELCCYVAVLVLGVLRLLKPLVVGVVLMLCWITCAALATTGEVFPVTSPVYAVPRLGLMFACGGLLWLLRDQIRLEGWLAFASALALGTALMTPHYRLVAAPALTYLCLYFGLGLGRFSRLRLSNDLSYGVYLYGAPLQTAMLVAGVSGASWLRFSGESLAVILPVAALSWFVIERQALGLKRRHASWARTRRLAGSDPLFLDLSPATGGRAGGVLASPRLKVSPSPTATVDQSRLWNSDPHPDQPGSLADHA